MRPSFQISFAICSSRDRLPRASSRISRMRVASESSVYTVIFSLPWRKALLTFLGLIDEDEAASHVRPGRRPFAYRICVCRYAAQHLGEDFLGHLFVLCFDYPNCYRCCDDVVDVAYSCYLGDRMRNRAVFGSERVFDYLPYAGLRIHSLSQILEVPSVGRSVKDTNRNQDHHSRSYVRGDAPNPTGPYFD